MARILAIDFGKKRTGLAVTDPLKMIATGLRTVPTHELVPFLKQYLATEAVEAIVIGDPKNLDGTETDASALVTECIRILQKNFPGLPILKMDERFTSKMATRSILDAGAKKKQRQDKALVDEVSATILLQGYLQAN